MRVELPVFSITGETHARRTLPEKGYMPQEGGLVFSRKKKPCNNRKRWEASVPRLPSKAVLETMAACGSGILVRK